MQDKHVRIFDTTLRDGSQTPGVHISNDDKVTIARALAAYGVDTIEAGFPASSPGEAAGVRRVAEAVTGCEVAAFARCVDTDIDAAAAAIEAAPQGVVHVFFGVSDLHIERKLRTTRAAAITTIDHAVRHAAATGRTVQFSAEDASRADPVFVRQCVETAINAGATRVNIPDTVGFATPEEYGVFIGDVVRFVDGAAIIAAHCHDDFGLATANSIAAVRAGAGQVEVTVNGIGERAGNAPLEEVALILAKKQVAPTRIQLPQTLAVSNLVRDITGVVVQPNRAIVGENAFAHSSGIHQDGLIKHEDVYAAFRPEEVGVAGHRFVLTARSGRSAVARAASTQGCTVPPEQMDALYAAFITEAERSRGTVSDAAVGAMARQILAST